MRVLLVVVGVAVWLPATVSAFDTESLIASKDALISAADVVRSARLDWETAHELLLQRQLAVQVIERQMEKGAAPEPATAQTLASAREVWKRALQNLEAKAVQLERAEQRLRDAEERLNKTQLSGASGTQ
jgi:hypothetical protein